jgi:hypothetical protein
LPTASNRLFNPLTATIKSITILQGLIYTL